MMTSQIDNDVMVDFSDSDEGDEEEDSQKLAECCQETTLMIETVKKEAAEIQSQPTEKEKGRHWELKVSPEVRSHLARKLTTFLDERIEVVDNTEDSTTLNDLGRRKRVRVTSQSNVRLKDVDVVSHEGGQGRPAIPLHSFCRDRLIAATDPEHDITALLQNMLQPG
eukprot:sb/3472448/